MRAEAGGRSGHQGRGSGLLASGHLGGIIRDIQAGLARLESGED